jgi:hypothetical protein
MSVIGANRMVRAWFPARDIAEFKNMEELMWLIRMSCKRYLMGSFEDI